MKKISWLLIIAICLELLTPSVLSMQQTVDAQREQQVDLLTIDSIATQYHLDPSFIIERLNEGYSLKDILIALQAGGDISQLTGTLKQLFPEKGRPYQAQAPTVTEVTYNLEELKLMFPNLGGAVTDTVYGGDTVTNSVYQSLSISSRLSARGESYDELALKNQYVKLDQAPYSVSSGVENISTLDGSLSISGTDIGIPGRNGLSFNLTRSYNSNAAEFYDKTVKQSPLFLANFSPLFRVKVVLLIHGDNPQEVDMGEFHTQSSTYSFANTTFNAPRFAVVDRNFKNVNEEMKRLFPDPNQIYGTQHAVSGGYNYFLHLYPSGAFYINSYDLITTYAFESATKPNVMDKRTQLGKGWSWDIPYTMTDDQNVYISLPSGGTYKVNANNQLENYPWNDITFTRDSSKTFNGVQTAYVLKYKRGMTYYFSSQGYLIRQEDAYGNYLNYVYEKVGDAYVLKRVSDPIGNNLELTYNGNQIVASNGREQVVYQTSNIPGTDLKYLQSVTDVGGRATYYNYDFKESKFNITSEKPDIRNDYALISGIHHPTGAKTYFSYDAIERNTSGGTKQIQFRVTERKDVTEYTDGRVIESNNQTFRYESDPYASYGDRTYTTIVSNGGLNTSYKYKKLWNSGNPKFFNNETVQVAGGSQRILQQTYDEASSNPYPVQIISKSKSGDLESASLIVTRQYDRNGNITSETTNMGGSTVTTYDPTFALPETVITKIDASQQAFTRYVRNAQGTVVDSKTYANAEGGQPLQHVKFEYDGFGNVTKVTANNQEKASVFKYQYGQQYQHAFLTQQEVEVTNADGQKTNVIEKATYDPLTGNVLSYTDALGQTTSYAYDRLGRTTLVTMPNQAQLTYVYNDSANHVMMKNTLGEVQQIWYDPIGRKIRETQGLGEVKYGYDERTSQLLWKDDAYNNRTLFTYDAFGRPTMTTYPDQTFSRVEYDDSKLTVTAIDAEQNRTRVTSDTLGREVLVETLQNKQNYVAVQKNEYNVSGAVIASVDGNGNRTTYSYDAIGRLSAVTDATNQKTSYQYDMLGNVTNIIYANQQSTKKEYNELGQVNKSINGTGQVQKYYYDANGNLVSSEDRSGTITENRFNNMNQLIQTITGGENVQFTYDTEGKRLSMTDHRGTTTYKYQGVSGFLTEIQYPDGVQVINNYDLNKKTGYELRSPQANVKVNATYNNMNRQDALGIINGNTTKNIRYDYLKNGQISSQSYGEAFTSERQYTDTKLSALKYVKNSVSMNTFQYGYDVNQNIISRNENNYLTSFTYTPLNQIKTSSEFNESYTYDARYNRLTLESSREIPIQETQYEYDLQNRLTKVTGSHSPVAYSYTGEGLLYERTENSEKSRYYYDANQLLLAEAEVVNGQAQIKYVYVHDLAGKLIGRQDITSGEMQYYQLNGHGDVVALVDEQGQKLNEYRYDIWGQPLEEKETVPNILKYSGEYWDKTTGLQYLRARWYDPSMGRFINEDTYEGDAKNPLSQNLYTYVLNNPLKYIDPSGNYCVSADGKNKHTGGCTSFDSTYVPDSIYNANRNKSLNELVKLYDSQKNNAVKDSTKIEIFTIERNSVAITTPSANTGSLLKVIVQAMGLTAVLGMETTISETYEPPKNQTFIFRSGSGSNTNLTPRPVKDASGLSFFITPVDKKGVMTTIEAINATKVLKAKIDNAATGHVSVMAVDPYEHKLWMASRENATTNPYYLTIILQNITIKY